jgi:hypothetical protein
VLGSSVDGHLDAGRILDAGERLIEAATPRDALLEERIAAAFQTADAAAAFALADDGFITVLSLVDRFLGAPFTVVTAPVGGSVRGAAFGGDGAGDAADVVARVEQGLFTECPVAPGQSGSACSDDGECGGAPLSCAGRGSVTAGRCADASPRTGEGQACTGEVGGGCAAGLFCAGLSEALEGICVSPWLTTRVDDVPWAPIPDGGALALDLDVTGLGAFDMDVELAVAAHASTSSLRLALESPAGTVVIVFDGGFEGDLLLLNQPVPEFGGDEQVNGTWRLHVEDTAQDGVTGALESWRLSLSSRVE